MKKILESNIVHMLIVIGAVTFGVYAYFVASPTGEAVSIQPLGTIKGSLVPYSTSLGTESFTLSFNSYESGVGGWDVSGWKLTDGSSVVHVFDNLVLNDGESVTICPDESASGCDLKWDYDGEFWPNADADFSLRDANNQEVFTAGYSQPDAGEAVYASKELTVPVYGKNDKITICHEDNKGTYMSKNIPSGPFLRAIEGGKNSHADDPGDIIPGFYYDIGTGLNYYEGHNWPTLKSVLDAGCQ